MRNVGFRRRFIIRTVAGTKFPSHHLATPQLEGRLSKFLESVKKHSKDFRLSGVKEFPSFMLGKKAIRLCLKASI